MNITLGKKSQTQKEHTLYDSIHMKLKKTLNYNV